VREASGNLEQTIELVPEPEGAALQLVAGGNTVVAEWTYAVAAPFPTVRDSITLAELRDLWQATDAAGLPVFASPETIEAMRGALGEPGDNVRSIGDAATMVDSAWQARPACAVVPFEDLEPRWKVLELDGQSPIRRDFDPSRYPLRVAFGDQDGAELPEDLRQELEAQGSSPLPLVNRRSDRLTTVVMTGVTALTRATAWQMNRSGVTFPSRDIGAWLRQADFTHVSNEVSFTPDCPDPLPDQTVLLFCASPPHLALLEDVGVDLVELTGNHLLDVGPEAMRYTLDLYRQLGLRWFGGGEDLAQADLPVLIEHNGIASPSRLQRGRAGRRLGDGRSARRQPCGEDRLRSQAEALAMVTFRS
jgi:poly-gamma-glutamate synthesis protein (capsule biosynthesis protein)